MQSKHNPRLVANARTLRKNITKEERHLWYDFLRSYPIRFLRQKILGRYIVDFYCPQARIVVELDGSQHYSELEMQKDAERTAFLEGYGVRVFRIPNNEVTRNFVACVNILIVWYSNPSVSLTADSSLWEPIKRNGRRIYYYPSSIIVHAHAIVECGEVFYLTK